MNIYISALSDLSRASDSFFRLSTISLGLVKSGKKFSHKFESHAMLGTFVHVPVAYNVGLSCMYVLREAMHQTTAILTSSSSCCSEPDRAYHSSMR